MRPYVTVLSLALLAGGCAKLAKTSPAASESPVPSNSRAVDTMIVVDTVQMPTAGMADLEARAARLQLQLLEREAVIDGLRQALDSERQEVVRNMAKLQSQANRAEGASGMAEAEIALQSLAAVAGGEDTEEHFRGAELLDQAAAEFAKENYGGALYLATEARAAAADGQARIRGAGAGTLGTGESLFALPVPLITVSRSNVRAGPGLGHSVSATLDPQTLVTGLSYTNEWVRVDYGDGQKGWVFHTLVTSEAKSP